MDPASSNAPRYEPPAECSEIKAAVLRSAYEHLIPGRVQGFHELGIDLVMGQRQGYRFWDIDGQEFLDFHLNGGVFTLGHRNPELVAILRTSLESLDIGNHHFPSVARAELAETLARAAPGDLPYSVFTSGAPRANDSARTLLPEAELIADPLFSEAPLTVPRIPLLKVKVPVWMVVARIMWHAGFHPEIESYRRTKARAATAADILVKRAETNDGIAVLVAHGYFNAIIGRVLKKRGFARTGSHRYRFWNAVLYERT